ncbi:Small ribosomal subunit protein uS11x-like protein, partial [Drosera capensis]
MSSSSSSIGFYFQLKKMKKAMVVHMMGEFGDERSGEGEGGGGGGRDGIVMAREEATRAKIRTIRHMIATVTDHLRHIYCGEDPPQKMSKRKTKEPKEENVTLGPAMREGEHLFGVAHIYAS